VWSGGGGGGSTIAFTIGGRESQLTPEENILKIDAGVCARRGGDLCGFGGGAA
jgi:hypothetical protein